MKFPKLKLKPAKKHDIRFIAKLFRRINPKKKEDDLQNLVEKKQVFVLKNKKKIIAAFSYTVIGIAGIFAIMYISKLAVVPELQGKGIGTFMLSQIKRIAVKAGVSALFLISVEKSKEFYKRNKLRNIWRIFWWRKKTD